MQSNDKNNGIGTVVVGYNHPPRIFRRPGEQGVIPGHYDDGDAEHVPDLPVPVGEMLHNADKALCPKPRPPKPPKPAPVPCNCPPRTYRNPPDVIVDAGENIKVATAETDSVTTYTVSAIPAPVKVDPDTMFGDGVTEPIGVYEYDGDSPGLVPEAPDGTKDKKFLRADGTWEVVDFPVDQALDPNSPNAVSNKAVCAGLSAMDDKINELDEHIQAIPLDEVHGIVDPETPEDPLDFDNEGV